MSLEALREDAAAMLADFACKDISNNMTSMLETMLSYNNSLVSSLEFGSFAPPPCEQRSMLYIALCAGALVVILLTLPACCLVSASFLRPRAGQWMG